MNFNLGIGAKPSNFEFSEEDDVSSEYQAILSRATTLGYTKPSSAQQEKQNTLITTLKDAGIWALLDCLYVFANDGSKEFATFNWISPSNNQATLVNSPTWTSNGGYKGNGSTSYIDTNFNISTHAVNYTQNNASRGMWVKTIFSVGSTMGGLALNNGREQMQNDNAAGQRINQAALSSTRDFTGTGLKTLYRYNSTDTEGYNNLTSTTIFPRTSEAPQSQNFLIGRSFTTYGDPEISILFMGNGVTIQTLHSSLYNAFNNYMSTL